MRQFGFGAASASVVFLVGSVSPAGAESLFLAYPPEAHETVSDRIFLIGTADPDMAVRVNGQLIEPRSPNGHFAPSLPLQIGENRFTLTQGEETLTRVVTRLSIEPVLPADGGFVEGSLQPAVDLARMPGELVCLGAVAAPDAQVSVTLAGQSLSLMPQSATADLPPNSAVLTDQSEPIDPVAMGPVHYAGCLTANQPGSLGNPTYTLTQNGRTLEQTAPGAVQILSPTAFEVAEVTAEAGVARTGPSTNHSRLTPLPQGTRAAITGREGDWLRLDYGGWIRAAETQVFTSPTPPQATIRGITSRQVEGATELWFPLTVPVPISLDQTAAALTLTLHNTVPQTDTIFLNDDPIIERLDWRPILPDQAQYTVHFKTPYQWGYQVRYEGTTLVLSLRHPPDLAGEPRPLAGATILVDAGHGATELGARGPNGYPEKDVNLVVSQLLRDELEARGATVIMTREGDEEIGPNARGEQIQAEAPTLALSIHYNALPDSGDALNTAGIGMFWFHPQAHNLAVFLHNYLVKELDRPSYGVFWNNLALTRPHAAPALLLELGFMTNPFEFEWITDPQSQRLLAQTLADGIQIWLTQATDGGDQAAVQ